jgi:hypothetical protein
MRSLVWGNLDFPESQGWGCTDLTVETPWPACPSGYFHTGIDFPMPVGTPIYAPFDGTVVCTLPYYGIVILESDLVWEDHHGVVVLAHLSVISATGHVTKGEQLGLSGNTGISTGPHLHFDHERRISWQGIFVGGLCGDPATSIDPTNLLQDQEADMTPEEHDALMLLKEELGVPVTPGGIADHLLKTGDTVNSAYDILSGKHLGGPSLDEMVDSLTKTVQAQTRVLPFTYAPSDGSLPVSETTTLDNALAFARGYVAVHPGTTVTISTEVDK